MAGGREAGRSRGRHVGRQGGRQGGRKGGREAGREAGRDCSCPWDPHSSLTHPCPQTSAVEFEGIIC